MTVTSEMLGIRSETREGRVDSTRSRTRLGKKSGAVRWPAGDGSISHTLGIRDNRGQSGQYKVKDTARSKSGAVRWSLNMTGKSHTLGIRDCRGQSGQYKFKI